MNGLTQELWSVGAGLRWDISLGKVMVNHRGLDQLNFRLRLGIDHSWQNSKMDWGITIRRDDQVQTLEDRDKRLHQLLSLLLICMKFSIVKHFQMRFGLVLYLRN